MALAERFNRIRPICKKVFEDKQEKYGEAYRILRPMSLVDQMKIKISRIRNIEDNKKQEIEDSIQEDCIGLINYSIIALLLKYDNHNYDKIFGDAFDLCRCKNKDYGDNWKEIATESITDLIYMKVLRLRHLIENEHDLCDSIFLDIINYSVFRYWREDTAAV